MIEARWYEPHGPYGCALFGGAVLVGIIVSILLELSR